MAKIVKTVSLTNARLEELDQVQGLMRAAGYDKSEVTDQRAISMAMQYILARVRPGERIVWTWREGRMEGGGLYVEEQSEY